MAQQHFPPIPDHPQQEGGRWRFHKPTSEMVAAWFRTQPLDEGMKHEDFVGGVVVIPQVEKVKYTRMDGQGTAERHEMMFTPYMTIGTRVAYFRRLAESRDLIVVSEAAEVPRTNNPESAYFNGNLVDGLWWHVVRGREGPVRYLCSTWRVALYEPTTYAQYKRGQDVMPRLEATGTKQVGGFPDINMIAKAQTGSLGRALGVAGILVIGTGIASAEDMTEFVGASGGAPVPEGATLPPSELPAGEPPPPTDPASELEVLRARAMALQTEMQERSPETARTFVSWYTERKQAEGWKELAEVPFEGMKAIVAKMEQMVAALPDGVEAP